jgi:uncharacterized protein YndB with AHSA1/START domain
MAHAKAQITTRKPIKEVFKAVIDPTKLCCYFTSKASASLIEGTIITWHWTDIEDPYLIKVKKVEEGNFISFT